MVDNGENVFGTVALPRRRKLPPKRSVFRSPLTAPFVYLVGIAAAELVTSLVTALAGIAFHILLLFSLVLHSSLAAKHPSNKLYLALALAPVIRIVSLSMPLSQFTRVYSYLIIAVPVLVAIFVIIRILNYHPREVSLSLGRIPVQALVGLTGVGFGLVEYYILRPEPVVSTVAAGGELLVPILIFLIATGFVEELAFRGLIQRSATVALGPWGWVYVAALFSVLHIGYLSVAHWLFVFSVGLFFGWVVKRTGSLLGVTLSHAIANIGLYVMLPFLLR